jgi:D-3-phosphoglycerate dehydrogenase
VVRALTGELVENAVNVPGVSPEDRAALDPYVPLAEKLGRVAVSLADGGIERLEITCAGGIGHRDTRLLTLAVLRGALHGMEEDDANLVNARALMAARGIDVRELRREAGDYTNLIRVQTSDGVAISGTLFGKDDRTWLVRARGYEIEIELAGLMLFVVNDDRPGMIGKIGTLLGEAGVNVANMNVARNREGGMALSAIQVDGDVPPATLDALRATPGLTGLRVVRVE